MKNKGLKITKKRYSSKIPELNFSRAVFLKSMQSKVTREPENIESLGAESLTLLDRCVFVFVSGRLCLWVPLQKKREMSPKLHTSCRVQGLRIKYSHRCHSHILLFITAPFGGGFACGLFSISERWQFKRLVCPNWSGRQIVRQLLYLLLCRASCIYWLQVAASTWHAEKPANHAKGIKRKL